jgi:hypothetical protein
MICPRCKTREEAGLVVAAKGEAAVAGIAVRFHLCGCHNPGCPPGAGSSGKYSAGVVRDESGFGGRHCRRQGGGRHWLAAAGVYAVVWLGRSGQRAPR